MGWYTADEAAVRSKGTLYFTLHQHGIHLTGRWVGLSYDARSPPAGVPSPGPGMRSSR